jgi:hypothetical protein
MKKKTKRVSQNKLWKAARLYGDEAEKCFKAKAYFSTIVARGAQLEAILRIFDFVETHRPKERCAKLYWLINRAFARHWIPHDGLRYWKRIEKVPLKTCLHELREARNGLHAPEFDHKLVNRRVARNVTYLVESMYALLEIKNARNFMKLLHQQGEVSDAEYKAWKKKQVRIS